MATQKEKLLKKLRSELTSAGFTTKSISSEDGSSLSMRSAAEIKELLDIAGDDDAVAAGSRKIRFIGTRAPGAY